MAAPSVTRQPDRREPHHSSSTASGCAAHWGAHLPPGVFVRASDVAHVRRAGDGIIERFVGLA